MRKEPTFKFGGLEESPIFCILFKMLKFNKVLYLLIVTLYHEWSGRHGNKFLRWKTDNLKLVRKLIVTDCNVFALISFIIKQYLNTRTTWSTQCNLILIIFLSTIFDV